MVNSYSRIKAILYLFSLLPIYISAQELQFKVFPEGPSKAISPYIYGINAVAQSPAIYSSLTDLNLTSDRLGGNRLTGYNWENNASSAGADWQHNSDNWLTSNPLTAPAEPLGTLRTFFEYTRSNGRFPIIQLPMAGFVAADTDGPVSENEAAPSSRWKEVVFRKGSSFSLSPDLTDYFVYIDECIYNLVQLYGTASQGGVKAFCLDNEPGLWNNTHPRIFPVKVTAQQIIDKSASLASAVKAVDPTTEIFGLESWGYWEMHDFTDAVDWGLFSSTYDWAISAYLGEMKKKSDAAGLRLLDVLAIHWYPEARGDGKRITGDDTTSGAIEARLQAPRSLWDPDYKEDSWIMDLNSGNPLNLLPRVKRSIDQWYPETKLAVTEYSYGASNHWSGGLALADVLGIFAREGIYTANLHVAPVNFLAQAFKLFRNIDGYMNGFGDMLVPSVNADSTRYSIYSSVESGNEKFLHVIIINKKATDTPASLKIEGTKKYLSGVVYGLAKGDTAINPKNNVSSITENSFTYTLPGYSMLHFVLSTDSITVLPRLNYYTLLTSAVGEGTVTRSIESIRIAEGTEVTLTATARSGWTFAGWSGDDSSKTSTIRVTVNRDLDIRALFVSAEELLVNGDFSEGKTGWTFSTWSEDNSAEGTQVIENGILKYTVANGGPYEWNVQFFQGNIPLVKGKTYVLSFDARSESSDSFNLFLGSSGTFGNVSRRIGLSNEFQTFTIPFVMDSASTPSARLSFDLGGANRSTIFYFDNISIKADDTGIRTVSKPSRGTNRLISAVLDKNIIRLNVRSDGLYKIGLFNLSGRLVKNLCNGQLKSGNYNFAFKSEMSAGVLLLKVRKEERKEVLRLSFGR